MDTRTFQIADALDGTAVEILLELAKAPMSEKELLTALPLLKQSNVHKRLDRLAAVGLIHRPNSRARGKRWSVRAPSETRLVVEALLDLAEQLDEIDRNAREVLRESLAKASSSRIRLVSDD